MVYTDSSKFPQGLALNAGQMLYANGGAANPAVYSVNPTTGVATLVSNDFTVGTSDLFGGAVGGNGTIYATSVNIPDVIYAIDPRTGIATILAGIGVGGTTFGALSYGIAVYPAIPATIHEPSSGVLLALCMIGLIFSRRRRVLRLSAKDRFHGATSGAPAAIGPAVRRQGRRTWRAAVLVERWCPECDRSGRTGRSLQNGDCGAFSR